MFKKIKEQLDEIDASNSPQKDVEMRVEGLQIDENVEMDKDMTDE